MIKYTSTKKSHVAKDVTKIISSISTLKFERECELSTQQKEWLGQSLVLLKKVLAEVVR